jgi:hypothetical protein
MGAPARDHGVVPGGAERAEERHVSLIERFAAEELPTPFVDAPAAGGVTATVLVRIAPAAPTRTWTSVCEPTVVSAPLYVRVKPWMMGAGDA